MSWTNSMWMSPGLFSSWLKPINSDGNKMRKKCVLLRDPVDDDEEGTRVQTDALIKDLEHRSVELKAQLSEKDDEKAAEEDLIRYTNCILVHLICLDANLQDLISGADIVSAEEKDDKRNVYYVDEIDGPSVHSLIDHVCTE
nr:thylakoid lumenal 19 kDa protein, chloroplastic [Tanacetum cinerariifolium]